jgi:hypothetical protein
MNRIFLTGVIILTGLVFIVSKSYAWDPLDIRIYDWRKHSPLSVYDSWRETIVANVTSGGPIEDWNWNWPSGAYDTDQTDQSYKSTGYCRFKATGRYLVWATGYDRWGQSDSDWAYVYVFEMDLDISGVSDDDEEDPGGYVCLNDDDDNGNSTPDKDETGTVSGEDDLVAISLSYEPSSLYPGCIELKVLSSNIRVWTSSDKGTLVIPDGSNWFKRWSVGSVPSTLYVEGYSSGTAELELLYTTDCQNPYYPGGGYENRDMVKFTVVKVNIDAGLSEADELNPGKYINVNWDDDDADGWQPNDNPPNGVYTADKGDLNIAGGDNDFRSFTVSISPQQAIVNEFPDSKVSITFQNKVKVWATNTKKTAKGESSELTSGSEISVEDLPKQLYLEGVSGSSSFKDVELKATWLPKSFSDTVKVTVFEVDLTGLFGYGSQQSDNDKKHSTFGGSSDKNGKISWDDANADGTKGDMDPNCEYFHNCMECQGSVMPSGVTDEAQFEFKRDAWAKFWKKLSGSSWVLDGNYTPWTSDDPIDSDEDLTPSANNNIYQIDGPGYGNKNRGPTWDYLAMIGDFREWVMVSIDGNWYQCSDYYKWHTKCYTKPKDANYMTRDSLSLQQLGGGWITVPNNP